MKTRCGGMSGQPLMGGEWAGEVRHRGNGVLMVDQG